MIYKAAIGLLVFPMFFLSARAQDTLVLNNGTELYVKVIEIGEATISYKKSENLSGPTYVTDISKVFMALYKDGSREIFSKNSNLNTSNTSRFEEDKLASSSNVKAVLSDGNFEVRLSDTKVTSDKRKKYLTINATVDAYIEGRIFTQLNLITSYAINVINNDAITIVILVVSERIRNILWEKYENYDGKGYRWDLPNDFFYSNTSSCTIKHYTQKFGNKEIASGFGGKSHTILNLKDCSSLENKLLSVALVWLQENFKK